PKGGLPSTVGDGGWRKSSPRAGPERRARPGAKMTIASQHRHAAAGAGMLPGHKGGFGRAEDRDRRGDLGRVGEPANPSPAAESAHLLEELGIGPARLAETGRRWFARTVRLGLDAARRDAVDGDPVAYDLAG